MGRRVSPAGTGLVLAAVLALWACREPRVGGAVAPRAAAGYELALAGATVDDLGHVTVAFTLTQDSTPVPIAAVASLQLGFTLAGLLPDPVSGLPTWQSYTLHGAALSQLPLDGPGTPPASIRHDVEQPGAEIAGPTSLLDRGGGQLAFGFATALPPGFDRSRTLRVGAWLGAVTGTDDTSATLDWVPSGGQAAARELAVAARCDVCHGRLTAHGGSRRGLRLCLTCHTIQNADPDTIDPAAPVRALTVLPEQRAVVAGTAATSFSAQLLGSSATVGWALSPASGAGTLSAASGGSVGYAPPAAVSGPTAVTLTASAAGLVAPVAITVLPAPAAPGLIVTPSAQELVVGGPGMPVAATLLGVTGTTTWSLSPASGAGALSATSGASVTYTPPASIRAATPVTLTASAGGQSATATFTLVQGVAGGATRFSDPNPLDLGRLVHRLHRGKNLPTLYLASSTAPAPSLPPGGTTYPAPFLPGRNQPAPGGRYSIVGDRAAELVGGAVVSRIDNGQPARSVVEGIGFPRDLRDCDVCHQDAPQQAEVSTAISRRTCQGCHPDVWFGSGPITDLVHLAHTGGPQADDSRCVECHVTPPAGQALLAPIAAAHLPLLESRGYNPISATIVSVADLQPGRQPSVVFTLHDETGADGGWLDSLAAPLPATDPVSPVPRALSRVAITLSGPSGDYLTGNAPLTESLPASAEAAADGSHQYRYTFAGAIPAGASGTWAVGLEARRSAAVPLFDAATQTFLWPYTGETIIESADNPVVYVDTAFGSWPGGAPAPRRTVVERARCQACHLDLDLHGGLRHNPEYCVMCHAPDATDWSRRPKDATGNVDLATVHPDGASATVDDLEERSIHFKVLIHRIHTGVGQGSARIEVGAPHVVYGFGGGPSFFDDVRFPGPLRDCTRCHLGATWTLGALPAGAAATTADEHATILHAATASHGSAEVGLPPMTAACTGCHGTAFALSHAARHTLAGIEQCLQCHVRGALGVPAAHGLPEP